MKSKRYVLGELKIEINLIFTFFTMFLINAQILNDNNKKEIFIHENILKYRNNW